MKWFLKVLILLLLHGMCVNTPFAQECSSINLMSSMWKVRDQGATGTCYAFSAAYLADHLYGKRFQSVPLRVSALDIAFQYGNIHALTDDDWKKDFSSWHAYAPGLWGGYPGMALSKTHEKGFCKESKFPDTSRSKLHMFHIMADTILKTFKTSYSYSLNRKKIRSTRSRSVRRILLSELGTNLRKSRDEIKDLPKRTQLIYSLRDHCMSKENYKFGEKTTDEVKSLCLNVSMRILAAFESVLDSYTPSQLEKALERVLLVKGRAKDFFIAEQNDLIGKALKVQDEQSNDGSLLSYEHQKLMSAPYSKDFFIAMVDGVCAEREKPQYGTINNIYDTQYSSKERWSRAAKSFVNKYLNQGYPVSFGYHTRGLFAPAEWDDKASAAAKRIAMHEGHVSTIIGRKKINNQCHYLVMNTWGQDWKPENGGAARKVLTNENPAKVRGGLFYISENEFLKRADMLTSYTKPKQVNSNPMSGYQTKVSTEEYESSVPAPSKANAPRTLPPSGPMEY